MFNACLFNICMNIYTWIGRFFFPPSQSFAPRTSCSACFSLKIACCCWQYFQSCPDEQFCSVSFRRIRQGYGLIISIASILVGSDGSACKFSKDTVNIFRHLILVVVEPPKTPVSEDPEISKDALTLNKHQLDLRRINRHGWGAN